MAVSGEWAKADIHFRLNGTDGERRLVVGRFGMPSRHDVDLCVVDCVALASRVEMDWGDLNWLRGMEWSIMLCFGVASRHGMGWVAMPSRHDVDRCGLRCFGFEK